MFDYKRLNYSSRGKVEVYVMVWFKFSGSILYAWIAFSKQIAPKTLLFAVLLIAICMRIEYHKKQNTSGAVHVLYK